MRKRAVKGKRYTKKNKLWKAVLSAAGISILCGNLTVYAFPAIENEPVTVNIVQNGGLRYDTELLAKKNPQLPGISMYNAFPEEYDLRDKGLVTPVKFQNPWGTCWAFGAISSLESNMISQTGVPVDYSEKALVWYTRELQTGRENPDDALEGIGIVSENQDIIKEGKYNTGGFALQAAAQMSSWNGASTEEQVPYRCVEDLIEEVEALGGAEYYSPKGNWSVSDDHKNDDAYRIRNASHILGNFVYLSAVPEGMPAEEYQAVVEYVTASVKEKLMTKGAVSMGYNADENSPNTVGGEPTEYFNKETNAQYRPDPELANHEVTVVGWKDNYEATNFAITPPGDGAWIVKNSWSDKWGEEGYFYLSYYDASIGDFTSYEADVPNAGYWSYDHNYQYDLLGNRSEYNGNLESRLVNAYSEIGDHWFANIFQAKGNETLKAVGVTDGLAAGDRVEVTTEIYRLNDKNCPVNGEPVSSQTNLIEDMLYSTIELDTPVELKPGEYFSVVQRLTAPDFGGADLYPIEFGMKNPVDIVGYDGKGICQMQYTAECLEGQSFWGYRENEADGIEWRDLGSEEADFLRIPITVKSENNVNYVVPGNAMIKAFTIDNDTLLDISNETWVLICYDAEGKEICRLENPDLSKEIEVPYNTATVALALADGSTSAISAVFGGQEYAANTQIDKAVFTGGEGTLWPNGAKLPQRSMQ